MSNSLLQDLGVGRIIWMHPVLFGIAKNACFPICARCSLFYSLTSGHWAIETSWN